MNKKTITVVAASILTCTVFAGVLGTTWANQAAPPVTTQQETNYNEPAEQNRFRNIKLAEPALLYTLKGEANVFEGTYQYVVKQGKHVVASGFGTASNGGPEWGTFAQTIKIPTSELIGKEPLMLEMFEINQENGKIINKLSIPLNSSDQVKNTQVFRNLKLAAPSVVYTVSGEASVFEGTYQYAVKQDEQVVAKGFGTASKGGPEWGEFSQEIVIPLSNLSKNNTSTLELFEIDQESGETKNKMVFPLK
ncbi:MULTISPECIES: Gmad2 immunoglobulin-like domain-containing protein [Brevibacillus]|uniref:Gmad2 immunoglobulin-like domain-containing protein n=1 Tax=Brevibacillus TaxID=55080 RepID=UPI001E6040B8|nr:MULTISPECIES: Gmad2 immunoglobulin-like domain-containing protein [Brevibacillus]MCE0451895.1 spore gernimation protein [Brevibacillus sp. AF8]UKK97624.1 spore gernimation protein [Brevibacillus brevis]